MAMSPRLLRPRATGFTPKSISGLYLWLDAADAESVTLNSGNVSVWRDKSGSGRNFQQSTSASQPIYTLGGQNAKNCLTFDGSRHLGSSVASTAWSFLHDGTSLYDIYVVYRTSAGSTQLRTILATGNSSRNVRSFYLWHDHRSGQNNSVYAEITTTNGNQYAAAETVAAQSAGVMRRLRITGDPANATVANRLVMRSGTADGTSDTTPTGTAATGAPASSLLIGTIFVGGTSFSGDLCEIVIFNRATALTALERSKIESYLDLKWGL